jgi:hypothetical protein
MHFGDKTTVTVSFRSFLPDSELELFFGKDNIVEVRRTSKGAEAEVYSDKSVEDLRGLLREREDNYHLEDRLRTDKLWSGRYRAPVCCIPRKTLSYSVKSSVSDQGNVFPCLRRHLTAWEKSPQVWETSTQPWEASKHMWEEDS